MTAKKEKLIQIGKLASLLNITTRTIRYYEEISLLEPAKRLEGGIRVYSEEDIRNIKFVLKLKELGISLKEMLELSQIYKLHKSSKKVLPRLLEILDNHISGIDDKINNITSLRKDIIHYRQKIIELMNNPSII
ncbi:MAG: MerR family transcriptional regulator [Deltaproteobacteria bacterium]|nr:MerR family transcriptional regulator [Deltaproteobacteria bacterium]